MVSLLAVFEKLAAAISEQNSSLHAEGLAPLGHTEIRVMGQMSLLSNPEVQAQIRLFGTRDVDATVKGEYWVQKRFAELLQEEGLELDPVAHEIWLPTGATFSNVFSSGRLVCLRLDPLFALASKALKAREKNRLLIRQAIPVFGEELRALIEVHGGDLSYFEAGD